MTDIYTAEAGAVQPVEVYFDDLDRYGMVYNAHYLILIDRAWVRFWGERGYTFEGDATPDTLALVREVTITYEQPITDSGTVAMHFWMEKVGGSSAVMGFRITSADGHRVHAHGSRVAIKVDPVTRRPAPWSDAVRADFTSLLREVSHV
ncbi:acyl-CoA thioesterase [Actinoplanes sp. CA-142083]|uniref:acyl-CoA thioesterase n=1 Tax=Actinoplanes sp. CA-142083 TaxID=3239903 RepID=UPI003D8C87A3